MICKFTRMIEKMIGGHNLLAELLRLYYRGMIRREIALARICRHDHVLFIGGGSIPCSAIEIAAASGARVDVIDVDPQAVARALQVVEKLNLSNKVRCSVASGQTINCAGYSVIHIALQAAPQEAILKNILAHAGKEARILVRNPRKGLKSLYSSLTENHICRHCAEVKQFSPTMDATLMFIPQNQEA